MACVFSKVASSLWVAQSAIYATNSGIWIRDGCACLIDPGVLESEIEEIAHFVERQSASVCCIVLTHAHWDHLLGVRVFPRARVIAQAGYLDVARRHATDLARQVAHFRAQANQTADPFHVPMPTETFGATSSLAVSDLDLTLYHAPGHAPDQCVLYEANDGILWAADMLSDQELPAVSHSLRAYRQTLARLERLRVTTLVPGHGTPTADAQAIRRRFAQEQQHLTQLHTCVRAALEAGLGPQATVAACAGVEPAWAPCAPELIAWNIETVYAELGGVVPSPIGWEKEWLGEIEIEVGTCLS